MVIEDDRTPEQKTTHRHLVVMTDAFMSGWGGAAGGASVAAWACTGDNWERLHNWVSRRKEARRVRLVVEEPLRRYRPRKAAHFHVYVVEPGHPGLS